MTTTRSYRPQSGYTLPPEAVEAAGKALDKALFWPGIESASWPSIVATATITAFIDHMIESEDMALESSRNGWSAYSIVLPAAKDPTT